MTIKSLLNSGTANERTLEKVADGFLAFPRKLWLGKSVEVVQQEGQYQVDVKPREKSWSKRYGSFLGASNYGLAIVFLFTIPFFLAANILATPLLGIGLILKKIALSRDPVAEKVNQTVEKYFENQPLVKEAKELTSQIDKAKVYIGDMEVHHRELEIKFGGKYPFKKDDLRDTRDRYERNLIEKKENLSKLEERISPDYLMPYLLDRQKQLQQQTAVASEKIAAFEKSLTSAPVGTAKERQQKAQLELQKVKLELDKERLEADLEEADVKIAALEQGIKS